MEDKYWDKLAAAFELYEQEHILCYEQDDIQDPPLSPSFRRRMNRFFREHCGEEFIPHPEVEQDENLLV